MRRASSWARTTTWRALPVKRSNTRAASLRSSRAAGAPSGLLGGFYIHDLVFQRPARGGHLDDLALLLAHDGLADGRLVRELVLGWIRFRGADDVVIDRLL